MRNADDLSHCDGCGDEIKTAAPPSPASAPEQEAQTANPQVKKTYNLSLSSTAKFPGPSDFDIIVDGVNQGKLKTGRGLTVSVYEQEIELLIKAWGTNPYKVRLRLSQYAYLEIGVWKNNIIFSGLSGADMV
jgi:hypothetical protein